MDKKVLLNKAMLTYLVALILFCVALVFPVNIVVNNFIILLTITMAGYHIIWEGVKDTILKTKSANRFLPNTHILMTLAALGAIYLGDLIEAALLIFIFSGAHFLEEYVEGKSKRDIIEILELNPREARKMNDNGEVNIIPVQQIRLGDDLLVLNGDQIPTDGVIKQGQGIIDESSINGESIPREKSVGDIVYGASINKHSPFIMEATKESSDTVFSKILSLVESSQSDLSPTAVMIKNFEPMYVKGVLSIFFILLLFGPNIFGWSIENTLTKGLTFIVSTSPCALAVSVIPATLAGIATLAKQGVIVKGGAYLSHLCELNTVAFDKTGTLTRGEPTVDDYVISSQVENIEEFLGIIVGMEKQSNHPLAVAITTFFEKYSDKTITLDIENKLGEGVFATYNHKYYQIAKPSAFENINSEWIEICEKKEQEGATVVLLAVNRSIMGLISIKDKPQSTASSLLGYLDKENIQSLLITGDSEKTGQAIARQLGINKVISNVLPEDKASQIMYLQKNNELIAMVGDGVNDAPALATANIGIAMGNGSDIAIETADIVILRNDLTKIITAHQLSKRLKVIIKQNICLAMGIVIILVIMTFYNQLSVVQSMVLHEGSSLIVLINSLRMLKSPK
ncbi:MULTISPECIES: heavy metal translocating P-type ATPase [Streptococcus]|uniref:heavy metal translocating P-type ATPase n=1 Tax=Streptococcus TaxID=1301 RepID=UPI000640438F|nr:MULTISPECIES: heavy metal translocating P-type ATPase [Streptococcus]KLL90538.1 metal ABC transporter ATPase [Streptococcus agalactiae]MDY4761564.1 heavy metal translocating P-type ATPase [Streptococcus thoraltensis]HEL1758865.1 cadmium-translocating P-type ATPase [Streptococcus suis]HEL1766634.1 cadmium-translocating P-type ATPase [Streptococcus suis]